MFTQSISLRSRRLEVVGPRKNGRARRRPLACLPRGRLFSLSPATSKRLLRRLLWNFQMNSYDTHTITPHSILS